MDPKIILARVESIDGIPGKDKLKEVVVLTPEPKRIVTNAPNVVEAKVGHCVVVALEGAEMHGEIVKRTSVGGRMSEGMLCDSRMLGWAGGGAGVAVFLQGDVGAAPPTERPRPANAPGPDIPVAEGLFEKKLSKEEKKIKAQAARDARKAKKLAAKDEATTNDDG